MVVRMGGGSATDIHEQRAGLLLNILKCTEQLSSSSPTNMIQFKMSLVPKIEKL